MTPRKPILSLPKFAVTYDRYAEFPVKLEPGPQDIAWAQEYLDKVRTNAAHGTSLYCMLTSILRANWRWRPVLDKDGAIVLREGPRR